MKKREREMTIERERYISYPFIDPFMEFIGPVMEFIEPLAILLVIPPLIPVRIRVRVR
jgi:hypothetical protein